MGMLRLIWKSLFHNDETISLAISLIKQSEAVYQPEDWQEEMDE